jgi:MFS family permease
MRTSEMRPSLRVPKAKGQIRAGIRYVWANPPLRVAMALLAVVALLGFNWQVLVPLLATRTFQGTATTYTLITSMMSVGSLTGSLRLARRRDVSLRFVVLSCLAFGGASLLFAASPTVPVAIVTGALAGNLGITFMAGIQTFIQLEAVPEMRGRAMALFTMLFMGTTPFGAPVVGWIAEHFGARSALALGGVVAALGAAVVLAWMRQRNVEAEDVRVAGREPAFEPV